MQANLRNEENELNMLRSAANRRPVSIARELQFEINKVTFEGESLRFGRWLITSAHSNFNLHQRRMISSLPMPVEIH